METIQQTQSAYVDLGPALADPVPARRGRGGRPPGSKNKHRTGEASRLERAIRANPRDPLAYLESIIADPQARRVDRIDCAKAALPYWHHRKATLLAVADGSKDERVLAALQATFGAVVTQALLFDESADLVPGD